jgi:hypothetical protein
VKKEEQLARQAKAEMNRGRFPETALVVDAFRREFGPDVEVRYIREGDVEMGRRSFGKAP